MSSHFKISFATFVIFLAYNQVQAEEASFCFDRMMASVLSDNAKLGRQYLLADPQKGQVRESNQTRIHIGTNRKAAVIVHGYAGSPFEVDSVAEDFQHLGYTTIQPLISGFGSSENVANLSNSTQWQESLANAVDTVAPCVESVTLVGFSLGGALVTDFVFSNPNISREGEYQSASGALAQIEKIVLASPFYRIHGHVPHILLDLIQSMTESVDSRKLYERTKINDLRAFYLFPDYYSVQMPLSAARHVVEYGQDLIQRTKGKSEIPILLAYSESDLTVDVEFAQKFVIEHFEHSQKFVFPRDLQLPHQFLIPAFNPQLNLFLDEMKDFLRGDSKAIIPDVHL